MGENDLILSHEYHRTLFEAAVEDGKTKKQSRNGVIGALVVVSLITGMLMYTPQLRKDIQKQCQSFLQQITEIVQSRVLG